MDHAATLRRMYDADQRPRSRRLRRRAGRRLRRARGDTGLAPTKEGVLDFFRLNFGGVPRPALRGRGRARRAGTRSSRGSRFTGTHRGDFAGVPASGKRVDVQLIDIIRFGDDGLAHEHWGVRRRPRDDAAGRRHPGGTARLGRDRARAARECRPGQGPGSRGLFEEHREGEAGGGVGGLAADRVGHLEGDAERGAHDDGVLLHEVEDHRPVSSLMTPSVKMR